MKTNIPPGIVTHPLPKKVDIARDVLGEKAHQEADRILQGSKLELAPPPINDSFVTQPLSASNTVIKPLPRSSYDNAEKRSKSIAAGLEPLKEDTAYITQPISRKPINDIYNATLDNPDTDSFLKKSSLANAELEPAATAKVKVISKTVQKETGGLLSKLFKLLIRR